MCLPLHYFLVLSLMEGDQSMISEGSNHSAISREAESAESAPWTTFRLETRPKSPRMVPWGGKCQNLTTYLSEQLKTKKKIHY